MIAKDQNMRLSVRQPDAWFFLDRDGTLNVDTNFVFDPVGVRIFAGAGHAVAAFRALGLWPVVVSNQSGIARGFGTIEQTLAVNAEVQRLLAREDPDAIIDHWLFCPHDKSEGCLCRKPRIGMLQKLFDAGLNYDPSRSWMAGDKLLDMELGLALGIPASQCLFLQTAHERSTATSLSKLSRSGAECGSANRAEERTEELKERLAALGIPMFPDLLATVSYVNKRVRNCR